MQGFSNWMNENFVPRANKFSRNVWVTTIQDSIMAVLPMIFVGSLITLVSLLNELFPSLPNFSLISSFSFGLMGIFVSFLIPFNLMEKKKNHRTKVVSGTAGLALYLMLLNPEIVDGKITFQFDYLGAGGMFVAMAVGILVAIVMNLFSKFSFFKNSSSLPDFVTVWFDAMLPITLILFFGWLFAFQLNVDLFNIIVTIFKPITSISQSFFGFVLMCFLFAFTYSFGISNWILTGIMMPFWLEAMANNISRVAQGLEPLNINTHEVVLSGWIFIGGVGTTLPLVVMMIFLSKSQKLKAIGRASIVPSIFNINEPVVFGAPIAFNPILMVPVGINSIIIPGVVYLVLRWGWVAIPSKTFLLWYAPFGLSTFSLNADVRGLILLAVVIAIACIIWFPFFKIHDLHEYKLEQENAEGGEI